MCLVLFVVSKILDSSEIFSMSTRNGCTTLSGMYQRKTAVWEGRGATASPREVKRNSGDVVVFT